MKIYDIDFSSTFWEDWEKVPNKIQSRFNEDIKIMSLTGKLSPSVNAHKVKNFPGGWWIGYISVGKNSWRFLFSISSSGTMVIERIMSHNSMDVYLKQ